MLHDSSMERGICEVTHNLVFMLTDYLDTLANFAPTALEGYHNWDHIVAFNAILKHKGWEYDDTLDYPVSASSQLHWVRFMERTYDNNTAGKS